MANESYNPANDPNISRFGITSIGEVNKNVDSSYNPSNDSNVSRFGITPVEAKDIPTEPEESWADWVGREIWTGVSKGIEGTAAPGLLLGKLGKGLLPKEIIETINKKQPELEHFTKEAERKWVSKKYHVKPSEPMTLQRTYENVLSGLPISLITSGGTALGSMLSSLIDSSVGSQVAESLGFDELGQFIGAIAGGGIGQGVRNGIRCRKI